MTDRDYLALTIYGEARGETFQGRLAVACVIQNRLRSGRWGTNYTDVCTARKQFSCWNVKDPNRALLMRLSVKAATGRPIPAVLRECYVLADVFLAADTIRQVGESTHYYARWMEMPPKWAATGAFVAEIGQHRFFEKVV
jgi:N-acetylmuramoyl-L-alanine amidase